MTERMTTLTRTLSSWMQQQEQEHSLAEVEQHVVRVLKELGASLVAGLCSLAAANQPERYLLVWSTGSLSARAQGSGHHPARSDQHLPSLLSVRRLWSRPAPARCPAAILCWQPLCGP